MGERLNQEIQEGYDAAPSLKWCNRHGCLHPTTDFGICNASHDGLHWKCKRALAEYRAENRDSIYAGWRRYYEQHGEHEALKRAQRRASLKPRKNRPYKSRFNPEGLTLEERIKRG